MRNSVIALFFLAISLSANSQELSAEDSLRRGADLAKAGQHAKAIPLLMVALRAFPGDASILWNLGISNSELGNHT